MSFKWQWYNDKHTFVPFDAKISGEIEKEFLKSAKTHDLTLGSQKYVIDFDKLAQINQHSKKERCIRRVDASDNRVILSSQPIWEWEESNKKGKFSPYDIKTCTELEQAYKKNELLKHIKVATGAHDTVDMVIHFGHMHQENKDHKAKKGKDGKPLQRIRNIRRVTDRRYEAPETAPSAEIKKAAATSATPARKGAVAKKEREAAKEVASDDDDDDDAKPAKKRRAGATADASSSAPATGSPRVGGGANNESGAKDSKPNTWTTVAPSVRLLNNFSALKLDGKGPLTVIAFDLDDTLVMPSSGAVFPKSANDWKWLAPKVVPKLKELAASKNTALCIISNQMGICGKKGHDPKKEAEVKSRVEQVVKDSGLPISAYLLTSEDKFRKPSPCVWSMLEDQVFVSCGGRGVDRGTSVYVGDAGGRPTPSLAGRKKDHSCSDRKFAYNVAISFATPEEFFLGQKPAAFNWDGIGPDDLNNLQKDYTKAQLDQYKLPPGVKQEVVIMVGYPGCGKSSFGRRMLCELHGYHAVNRDTLKTMDKCYEHADTLLKSGKSVVVDNTNPSVEDRARFVALAKKHKVHLRAMVMDVSFGLAMHMNIFRDRLGLTTRVSSIAYNIFKGKFARPTEKEGFDAVLDVPLVLNFSGLAKGATKTFYELT